MGLKYTNAFWNPRYYDHLRPTLTKQLLYVRGAQLLEEAWRFSSRHIGHVILKINTSS